MKKSETCILVVEDDKNYRKLVRSKLSSLSVEVLVADNGRQGLNFLKNYDVSLIILDLLMPEMSGWNFLYKMQKSEKKNIPVIILTNLTEASYPENIKNPIRFLVKANTSIDELVDIIKKQLLIE